MVLAVGALVALVGYSVLTAEFKHRAGEFDLADVEKMEAATVVLDRNGEFIGKFFLQNRIPVPADQISPLMGEAVISAEDNRFKEHDGVDFWGIVRAAIINYKTGRKKQGASTVTQQLARNSFDLHEKTYKRKLIEIFLAQRIEKHFSKDQIMALYLNRVYFGSGLYGIEAAARGYFGVPAKDLTVGQCAMLAGLLKSPNNLSPWNNPEGARNARNFVLGRMQDMGYLTAAQAKAEQESLLVTSRRSNPYKLSYAVGYVRQQAIAELGYERAMNGGFKIYTTLDLGMQRAAEVALRSRLNEIEKRPGYSHETYEQFVAKFRPYDEILRKGGFPTTQPPTPAYLQGAVIAYDNSTGGILALVGGRESKHSEYNRATQGRRPPGTVFAPFVLAAACEKGAFPGEIVQDSALDNRYVGIGGTTGILGEWGVERAGNEYEGGITAREAIANGKNAATVRLGWLAGMDAVRDTAKKAGIRSPLRNFANTYLGASEVALDELTLAFTTFADGGQRPKRGYVIDRIIDTDGSEIFKAKSESVPVVADSTAFQVTSVLEDSLRTGTAAAAGPQFGLGRFPAAVKTGTAYNFTDTYAIGFTTGVTCGVWVGFDKPTKIFRGAFGNDLALPIWTQVMNASSKDFTPREFQRPASVVPVSICRVSGLLETAHCEQEVTDPNGQKKIEKTAYIEYATAKSKPTIPCDVHGTGLRLYTARDQDESEWPRAVAAIDLAMIRPVAVGAPALVGLNDVYHSVRPAALRIREDQIPVAKAEPVNQQVAEAALKDGEMAVAKALPVTPEDRAQMAQNPDQGAQPAATPASQEVRRAEAVKPLDVPAASEIPVATPEPIQF